MSCCKWELVAGCFPLRWSWSVNEMLFNSLLIFFLLWRLTSEYSWYRPTALQLLMLCRLQFQMWNFIVVIVYLLYVFFFLWIPVNQWLFSTWVLAFYNYNVSVLWCCRYWNINGFPSGLIGRVNLGSLVCGSTWLLCRSAIANCDCKIYYIVSHCKLWLSPHFLSCCFVL